jgi:hypothetical protein
VQQAKSGLGLRGRTFLSLVLVAALVPSAWAYVNGGVFHETRKKFGKGWGVSFAAPLGANSDKSKEVADGVKVAPRANANFQRYVNQLIGQALKALPKEDAAKISAKDKRAIAGLARQAIGKAVAQKQQCIRKGQVGSLQYEVGVYRRKTWWVTNYGGKRETHAEEVRLIPFVAVKVDSFSITMGNYSITE